MEGEARHCRLASGLWYECHTDIEALSGPEYDIA